MLVKDLFTYQIKEQSDDMIAAEVGINAANELFDGHFPNMPITPGVLQVNIIEELLEQALEQKYKLKTLNRCKFLAKWDPSVTPSINVSVKLGTTEDGVKVTASGIGSEAIFKFNATYSLK